MPNSILRILKGRGSRQKNCVHNLQVERVIDLGQWHCGLWSAEGTESANGCDNHDMQEASQDAVVATAGRHGRVRSGLSRGVRTEIGDLWIKPSPAWSLPCRWESLAFHSPAQGLKLGGAWCLPRDCHGALDCCTLTCLHSS